MSRMDLLWIVPLWLGVACILGAVIGHTLWRRSQ